MHLSNTKGIKRVSLEEATPIRKSREYPSKKKLL
jgi:hypothetical protein